MGRPVSGAVRECIVESEPIVRLSDPDIAFPLYRFTRHYRIEPSGCWEWHGPIVHGLPIFGCGQYSNISARHIAFAIKNGAVPVGEKLWQTCQGRACVNPDHVRYAATTTAAGECAEVAFASMARTMRRRQLGQPPPDHTFGSTCGNDKCVAHSCFRLKASIKENGKWAPIARRIKALQIDESFDLPEYPQDSASISKLIAGVRGQRIATHLRFIVRAVPRKRGVRVIAVGRYANPLDGTEFFQSETRHPVLTRRQPAVCHEMRPGCLILGMLWDTSSLQSGSAVSACISKACILPAVMRGLCKSHYADSGLTNSGLWGGHLSHMDYIRMPDNPEPPLYSGMLKEDKYAWENVRVFWKGHYGKAHGEETSDEFWDKNVEPRATTRKEMKERLKMQVRRVKRDYDKWQSSANVRRFFNVEDAPDEMPCRFSWETDGVVRNDD